MNIKTQDVLIRMLQTPNPYALKFVLNVPLKNRGEASFHTPEETKDLPLLHSLWKLKGLKQIFVFQNQITLSHNGALSGEQIEQQVQSLIKTHIAAHNPGFLSFKEKNLQTAPSNPAPPPSPEVQKITEILDQTIRPGLRADGGDIEVLSAENNEVRIRYQGACSGCPSAFMGTLDAIENILRQETGRENLKIIPV